METDWVMMRSPTPSDYEYKNESTGAEGAGAGEKTKELEDTEETVAAKIDNTCRTLATAATALFWETFNLYLAMPGHTCKNNTSFKWLDDMKTGQNALKVVENAYKHIGSDRRSLIGKTVAEGNQLLTDLQDLEEAVEVTRKNQDRYRVLSDLCNSL